MKKQILTLAIVAMIFAFKGAAAQTLPASNIPNGNYYAGSTIVDVGGFKLVYQNDGNLVLYSTGSTGRALWASGPQVANALKCQVSGKLELFTLASGSAPYWVSPDATSCQYRWVLQLDGNLVRYDLDCMGGYTSISTGTSGGAVSSHFGSLQ